MRPGSFHHLRKTWGISQTLGGTPREVPIALAGLLVFVLVCVRLLQAPMGWNAGFYGKASLSQLHDPAPLWEVSLDPSQWEGLLAEGGPLAYLLEKRGVLEGQVHEVHTAATDLPVLPTDHFQGGPRVAMRYGTGGHKLLAELYQASSGLAVLSGPVTVSLEEPWVADESPGFDLSFLGMLPKGTDRVVWLDYSVLRVPTKVMDGLRAAWKKWEFSPSDRLADALAPPFCYARWMGEAVLMVRVADQEQVETELQRRYPDSVVPKVAQWREGARVEGLDWQSKPAWFFWQDRVVATPTGGVQRLSRFLTDRKEQGEYTVSQAFDQEFNRLAKLEKGWHVCLLESSSDSPVWWGLLLRIDSKGDRTARGYLVVELRPEGSWSRSPSVGDKK